MAEKDITIHFSKDAIEWLDDKGYEPEFGARPLKRVILKEVINQLSKEILKG